MTVRVVFYGGPYDGMHMALTDEIAARGEVVLPNYRKFVEATRAAFAEHDPPRAIEVDSGPGDTCVVYTQAGEGRYRFKVEKPLP